jgi:uncharacterized iron-regulated protein
MAEFVAVLTLILSSATGKPVGLETLVDDLAQRDVVFLGEEHDNDEGHHLQMQIFEALHQRRPDVVLSMEMFERDVQGVLDDYLRGRIDEETFLAHSRPWKNYREHYRPLVEYAKTHGLDVLAANSPWMAKKVTKRGGDVAAYTARTTTAPKDRYFDLFEVAMKDHPGEMKPEALQGMYAGQCKKDDTMAESITDYLQDRPHRRPLIVHLCGKFHCEYGLGTAIRVLTRRPLANVGVVTMASVEDKGDVDASKHLEKAHYVLVVQAQPKKHPDVGTPTAAEQKTEVPTAKVEETIVSAMPAKPEGEEAEEVEEELEGRAALGIMPDYGGTEDGVLISSVIPEKAAEKAGLKDGDLITKIGGQRIMNLEDYMDVLAGLKPGKKVDVVVKRGSEEKTLEVKLGTSSR